MVPASRFQDREEAGPGARCGSFRCKALTRLPIASKKYFI